MLGSNIAIGPGWAVNSGVSASIVFTTCTPATVLY